MDFAQAQSLLNAILVACPVDTGALKGSIQMAQMSERDWIVIIGNDDSSINGTATNLYAAKTNCDKLIEYRGRVFRNPNYHWLNNAIEKWASDNAINLTLEMEEYSDEV